MHPDKIFLGGNIAIRRVRATLCYHPGHDRYLPGYDRFHGDIALLEFA